MTFGLPLPSSPLASAPTPSTEGPFLGPQGLPALTVSSQLPILPSLTHPCLGTPYSTSGLPSQAFALRSGPSCLNENILPRWLSFPSGISGPPDMMGCQGCGPSGLACIICGRLSLPSSTSVPSRVSAVLSLVLLHLQAPSPLSGMPPFPLHSPLLLEAGSHIPKALPSVFYELNDSAAAPAP